MLPREGERERRTTPQGKPNEGECVATAKAVAQGRPDGPVHFGRALHTVVTVT